MFAFDDYAPWLNALLFAMLAVFFEILENLPTTGSIMWSWLGYTRETYSGDSAVNAASDVLISLIGWVGARGVLTATGSTAVGLGVTLGTAGALFGIFLFLYRIERRVQGIDASPEPVTPALILKA